MPVIILRVSANYSEIILLAHTCCYVSGPFLTEKLNLG